MSDLYLEIRDQEHLMNFEGSKDSEVYQSEIEKAVLGKGFVIENLNIWFDGSQSIWRFSGDLIRAIDITIGDYRIRRINIDMYELTGPFAHQKKTICGGDFETILSTVFI
jgi:hypothetical protein